MFGMPEILSWYFRRFREIFTESDIVKTLSPFVGPVTSAILNTTWSANDIKGNTDNPATQMLEEGTKALKSRQCFGLFSNYSRPSSDRHSQISLG